MLVAIVLTFCRVTVALAFALSAGGKALDIRAFQEAVTDFRLLRAGWSKAAAWVVLTAELAVVLLLAVGGTSLLVGFLLAAALLVIFSTALAVALGRNTKMTCNCFGRTERRISRYDIVRNALLLLCSLAGVWALANPHEGLAGPDFALVTFMATCFLALATNVGDVAETLRRPFDED